MSLHIHKLHLNFYLRFPNEKEVSHMAKKLKKARKGMSPEAKFTLGCAFKGLISNQAVIDGSRQSKWWVAAIFLAFSVFIPLIPTFVSLGKIDGASFISGYNYGLDEQLTQFAYDMKKADKEFKVEGGQLHYYEGSAEKEFVNPTLDDTYFINRKCEYSVVNSITNQFEAKFYFWSDENLSDNVDKIVKQTYVVGGQDQPDPDSTEIYLPNIVIFTPTTMAIAVYKANTNTSAGTTYGGLDWLNSSTEKGLVERLLGENIGDVSALTKDGFVNAHKEDTLTVFKGICTETYLNQKSKTKWKNTGIYLAIYAGVVVFLGLMVFILTRGKNNTYKFLNIWQCEKIAWWGAASPAIIGVLLSLIFSGNTLGQMAFILTVSLRIMWLSMKQLRPMYQ